MIKTTDLSQFLQAEKWARLQEKLGFKVIKMNGGFLAAKSLGGGWQYLYGAKINGETAAALAELASSPAKFQAAFPALGKSLGKSSVASKIAFIRFEPLQKNNFASSVRIIKTLDVQPHQTLILDLSRGVDELLKNMHAKTRYNIRLAEKKGVKILADNGRIDDFLNLLKTTTERDKFQGHPDSYYRALADFDPDFIKLLAAQYQGKIIAAGLFAFYGNTVTYLHGASSNSDRQVMAPYLLQWHLIKTAQAQGYKYYDFFGIDAKKWPGVTRFKLGFGGEILEYPGTFDLILRKNFYNFYKFLRKIRRWF